MKWEFLKNPLSHNCQVTIRRGKELYNVEQGIERGIEKDMGLDKES